MKRILFYLNFLHRASKFHKKHKQKKQYWVGAAPEEKDNERLNIKKILAKQKQKLQNKQTENIHDTANILKRSNSRSKRLAREIDLNRRPHPYWKLLSSFTVVHLNCLICVAKSVCYVCVCVSACDCSLFLYWDRFSVVPACDLVFGYRLLCECVCVCVYGHMDLYVSAHNSLVSWDWLLCPIAVFSPERSHRIESKATNSIGTEWMNKVETQIIAMRNNNSKNIYFFASETKFFHPRCIFNTFHEHFTLFSHLSYLSSFFHRSIS